MGGELTHHLTAQNSAYDVDRPHVDALTDALAPVKRPLRLFRLTFTKTPKIDRQDHVVILSSLKTKSYITSIDLAL
jgi:hypothetical protein